ncbi:MAG TPA: hypothetical protein ENH99_01010 [Candidatus Pacearchaeota archaeon]|nr:hypothetical protein [Candidatus Pacearchaeota archaeon]
MVSVSKVWEATVGPSKSDPEINARIVAGRHSIEAVLKPGVIRSIARAVFLRGPYDEQFSSTEVRRRLSRMRSLGWKFDRPYSKMDAGELKGFYREQQTKVGVLAGEICPDAMDEITAENESRVRGDLHY